MKIIVDNIKWIMLVAGVLTCTMLYAAFAPQASLQSTFGVTSMAQRRRLWYAIGAR